MTALIDSVKKYSYTKFDYPKNGISHNNNDNIGVIHISDTHFNEIIDLPHNKYDFSIASSRLKKLSSEAMSLFKSKNISNIKIVFSGDLINSNRRADEIMSACTNRSTAMVIASDILSKFIKELSNEFIIDVHYVVGNESRVGDELTFSSSSAYDNYDYMINQLIKARFDCVDNVTFHEPIDPNEDIVNIGGMKFLVLHGFNIKHNNMESGIQQLIGKYASQGVLIDYVLCGHVHATRISNNFSRSASLCGANAYSDVFLGLSSKASQNIFVVNPLSKSVNATCVDLQNADNYIGYDFHELEYAYNPKSVLKVKAAFKNAKL
jgi:predicted phosphodiesterase